LLPDSHNISSGLVVDTDSPVASGGYADVYKGIHKGVVVAVKVLRRGQMDEDDLLKIKKVSNASKRE
jgi:predicted unusual protein kinase regulating ubiquinone biosynthesis (AarF/ABC1/UbiB family)